VECGVWSVECGVWSVECGVWSVECGVWSVECGVWSVEFTMLLIKNCIFGGYKSAGFRIKFAV